jgi:hypothetical protein
MGIAARKRTDAEIKLEASVNSIIAAAKEVTDDLKADKLVPTQLLIDVIETQNEVMASLLRGFLEV